MEEKKGITINDGSIKLRLIVNEKEYLVSLSVPSFVFKDIQNKTYKEIVSEWIINAFYNHSEIEISDILKQTDEFFIPIFSAFINENDELKSFYEKNQDITDIFERFVISEKEYHTDFLNKRAKDAAGNISKTLSALSEYITGTIRETTTAILQSFDSVKNVVSDLIDQFNHPDISEERKNEIINSSKEWGKRGWTIPPFCNINALFEFDEDMVAPFSDYAIQDYNIEELFQYLLNNNCADKVGIDEAVFAFENQKYKSCILVMFSLIDNLLITNQKDTYNKSYKGYRKTGNGAAKNIIKDYESSKFYERSFYSIVYYTGLSECITAFFADGEDFSKATIVANRNYITHGMYNKPINKKDCIQVFLMYYNLLELLELMEMLK